MHFQAKQLFLINYSVTYSLSDFPPPAGSFSFIFKSIYIYIYIYIYTVGTESIQTPLNFSLFVILQPFAKII